MKKLLLSAFLVSSFYASAQVTIYSDNFDDLDISDWTLYDSDGDGFDWGAVQITDAGGAPVGTPQLRSASWNNVAGPLTPDNYIISPMLNLSAYPAGSLITLRWEVKASDAAYDAENYSVYVGTTDEPLDLADSPISFSETTLDGVNVLTPRSLDISSFAGEPAVYFAFRHYDVSDEFTMEIDNVSVTAPALATVDFFATNFSVYPNPTSNVINLNSASALINNVTLTDINGRIVKTLALGGVSQSQINLADLTTGVYFLSVESNLGTGVSKIVKN